MDIDTREVNQVLILDFSGTWSFGDGAAVSRSLKQLLDLGYRRIILNLSDIGMLPRSSVPVLKSFCDEAEKRKSAVKIVASSNHVRGTLRSGGFLGSTAVHRDELNALREF